MPSSAGTQYYVNDPWVKPVPLKRAITERLDKNSRIIKLDRGNSYQRPNTAPHGYQSFYYKKINNSPRSPRTPQQTPPQTPPRTQYLTLPPEDNFKLFSLLRKRPASPPLYQRPQTPPWYRYTGVRRPATADENKTTLAKERLRDVMQQLSLKNELIKGNRKTYTNLRSHNACLRQNAANQRRELHQYLHKYNDRKAGETPRTPHPSSGSRPVSVMSTVDMDTEVGSSCAVIKPNDISMSLKQENKDVISEKNDKFNKNHNNLEQSSIKSRLPSAAESYRSAMLLKNAGELKANCCQCHKLFIVKFNHNRACEYHSGLLIPLFGGTCSDCGRLCGQTGCAVGSHVAVNMTDP